MEVSLVHSARAPNNHWQALANWVILEQNREKKWRSLLKNCHLVDVFKTHFSLNVKLGWKCLPWKGYQWHQHHSCWTLNQRSRRKMKIILLTCHMAFFACFRVRPRNIFITGMISWVSINCSIYLIEVHRAVNRIWSRQWYFESRRLWGLKAPTQARGLGVADASSGVRGRI